MRIRRRSIPSLLLLACLVACGGATKPKPAPIDQRSLFERLGGQPAINAVVHEFVLVTKADARINQYFQNTDPVKLEQMMDEHVCSITGGACTYTGKSMLVVHTSMKLKAEDFAAFMEDLQQVLTKLNVPKREADEVIGAFTGMKADVVGH